MPEADDAKDATALPLLQVPPGVASDKVMDELTHTDDGPVIAAGSGLTVNDVVTEQPARV